MISPKKYSLIVVLSFFLLSGFSQIALADDEWRPITPEELAMTKPKVDADADAEAIFWEVKVNDRSRSRLTLEHYVRVKIFTERGREKYSKFDIPYTKRMKIKDIAARLIKADGTIVEIGKKDIFDRDIIKANKTKVKSKSFAVPNIEPGVIVEYKYREIIRNAGAVGMRLVFQRDIPVQKISYYYKPFVKKTKPRFQSYNFSDTEFVEDKKGFYLAERRSVPAFKEEPRMPPEDMVRPWMLLQGLDLSTSRNSAFSFSVMIKDPSSPIRYWSAYALERQGLVKYMTKKDKNIKKMAEQLTANATSDNEKLKKLYEFCQTEIHNTTFDASLTDEERDDLPNIRSVKDVLKKKQGSSGYVDMLFGSMAKSIGFEPRIAFSGDRSEMFFGPKMTNEEFVHPASIAIKVDDKWKFFNPGLKFLPYGKLAWFEEKTWALLVGDKVFDWVQTPLSGIDSSSATRKGKFKLLEDGTLEGEATIEYSGQMALSERLDAFDESDNKRKEDLIAELKSRISTAEISDVAVENIEDHSKPLVHKYKIRIPNYAQKTGKRMFFKPSVFEFGSGALFSTAERKYDIYFNYPWSEKDEINISLPEGFSLDNADAPAPVADPNNISTLKIKIGVDNKSKALIINRHFYFGNNGKVLFPASVYTPLKNLFDTFHKADNHTITLKKGA